MFRLTLARINIYLGRNFLDCATRHFNKIEDCYERARALDGYTPIMKLAGYYHAIWCYSCLWLGEQTHKIIGGVLLLYFRAKNVSQHRIRKNYMGYNRR